MATWRETIVQALISLGGEGPYDAIYAEVAARRPSLPPSWQAIVRRSIEQASSDSAVFQPTSGDLFRSSDGIGHGRWAIRSLDTVDKSEAQVAQPTAVGQGYALDSVVRKAIELHAVDAAKRLYLELGASRVEELGKPYDLRVLGPNGELHVEVKGSLRSLTSIVLTKNEVDHARAFANTDLFVMDQIVLRTTADGVPKMDGGRSRLWRNWSPSEESVKVTHYVHALSSNFSG